MRAQSLTLEYEQPRHSSSRRQLSREDLSRIRLGRNGASEQTQYQAVHIGHHEAKSTLRRVSYSQSSTEAKAATNDKRVLPFKTLFNKTRHKRRYQINKPRVGNFLTRKLFSSNRLVWVLIVAMILFGSTVTWMSYSAVKGIKTPFGSPSSGQSNAGTAPTDGELEESQPDILNYSVKANMPKIITIPSINSRGRVLHLGTDSSGTMAVPGNVHDTSWYNGSVLPGSGSGAAVIAGHKSGPRVPGVFMNLNKVSKGAEINVEKGDGSVVKYSVVATESIAYENVNMLKALTPILQGKESLTLITCGGKYNSATKTYESRDIVYATRIN